MPPGRVYAFELFALNGTEGFSDEEELTVIKFGQDGNRTAKSGKDGFKAHEREIVEMCVARLTVNHTFD